MLMFVELPKWARDFGPVSKYVVNALNSHRRQFILFLQLGFFHSYLYIRYYKIVFFLLNRLSKKKNV